MRAHFNTALMFEKEEDEKHTKARPMATVRSGCTRLNNCFLASRAVGATSDVSDGCRRDGDTVKTGGTPDAQRGSTDLGHCQRDEERMRTEKREISKYFIFDMKVYQ
jgi:hypothetical protein